MAAGKVDGWMCDDEVMTCHEGKVVVLPRVVVGSGSGADFVFKQDLRLSYNTFQIPYNIIFL